MLEVTGTGGLTYVHLVAIVLRFRTRLAIHFRGVQEFMSTQTLRPIFHKFLRVLVIVDIFAVEDFVPSRIACDVIGFGDARWLWSGS